MGETPARARLNIPIADRIFHGTTYEKCQHAPRITHIHSRMRIHAHFVSRLDSARTTRSWKSKRDARDKNNRQDESCPLPIVVRQSITYTSGARKITILMFSKTQLPMLTREPHRLSCILGERDREISTFMSLLD